jgi:dihydroxyacetone kinase-like protein
MLAARHFLNEPESLVTSALSGLERAFPELLRWNRDPSFVVRADAPRQGRVAVISGGGSGHEPLHTGFVGTGMLDAAVPGLVFASPSMLQIAAATAAVDGGRGVIHIVKNYTGDVINFGLARDESEADGIAVETVLVDDDLATDSSDLRGPGRRGTGAVIAVEKACGAAAARGDDLETVATIGRRVAGAARSLALALEAPTHPGAAAPSFELAPGEVEFGVGIHGERGIDRRAFAPAADLASMLVSTIADGMALEHGDSVIAIVNGLGSTHPLELYLMFNELGELLDGRGVTVARSLVGSYVTSLNMAGCSITLVRVEDDLLELWDAPVLTPGLRW